MKRTVLLVLAIALLAALATVVLAGFLFTVAHMIARMAGIA